MNNVEQAHKQLQALQSWKIKGFWFIPGTDLRVQIIEWDKLLEFIVQKLVLPELGVQNDSQEYNEISLGRIITAINARQFSLPTEYNDKSIQWAHRIRNKVVHDINFNFEDPKQREEVEKAITILESTCSHIVNLYDMENNWQTME